MYSDQPHRLARTGQDIEGVFDEAVPHGLCRSLAFT
jgi:hypothetical protein